MVGAKTGHMIAGRFMPSRKAEATRWVQQAENDLALARLGLRQKFFSQACFWAQQSAEQAVKGIGRLGGDRAVLEDSVAFLVDRYAERAPGLSDLMGESRLLDQYYRTTRYPGGSGPVPFLAFSREQATTAIEAAERFLELADRQVGSADR